jgi:hypothetical protein
VLYGVVGVQSVGDGVFTVRYIAADAMGMTKGIIL